MYWFELELAETYVYDPKDAWEQYTDTMTDLL